jgi:hypothetical protein
MAPEDLFLATLIDLEQRLELGRAEYDALCIAWLLRRLFLGGRRSLIDLVNHGPGHIDLRFEVRDEMFQTDPTPNIAGWWPMRPTGDGRPTAELSMTDFLARPGLVIWPGNDPTLRRDVSVRALIL